mmetsp:Transcript_12675/g.40022  ORF Transcript_12675/g.40022 Transcript_12675/m.40022 type:complete len:264 (+) Transcript_12675:270-1061(+)
MDSGGRSSTGSVTNLPESLTEEEIKRMRHLRRAKAAEKAMAELNIQEKEDQERAELAATKMELLKKGITAPQHRDVRNSTLARKDVSEIPSEVMGYIKPESMSIPKQARAAKSSALLSSSPTSKERPEMQVEELKMLRERRAAKQAADLKQEEEDLKNDRASKDGIRGQSLEGAPRESLDRLGRAQTPTPYTLGEVTDCLGFATHLLKPSAEGVATYPPPETERGRRCAKPPPFPPKLELPRSLKPCCPAGTKNSIDIQSRIF